MLEFFDLDSDLSELKKRNNFLYIIDDVGICYFDNFSSQEKGRVESHVLESTIRIYKKLGRHCFAHICNNASIILCDFRNNRLFVAVDKIGLKTFYYAQYNRLFILSTEIKKIAKFIPLEISRRSLLMYLNLDFIPGKYSIFRQIYKIPPSSYLVIENGNISVCKYYNFNLKVTKQKENLLRHDIKNALLNSIARYRNYELGLMLSGGFDSSLLCKLATETCGNISTFTLACEPYNTKSVIKSKEVARLYGTKHNEIVFTVKDYIKNFTLVSGYLDDLVFDRNLPIIYHLLTNIQGKIQFLLYGFGGDEIFGERLEKRIVNEIYNYSNIKKIKGIDNSVEIVYLFLITKVPQELLVHNKISSLYNLTITFPFLDYDVVKLGLRLSQEFRRNKYLLKTAYPDVLKLRPLDNRENSYYFLVLGRKVIENYYTDDIRTSTLFKELIGKSDLKLLLRNKNENDILKLILFQMWYNNIYK
jgi:asparagine synthetase B (glutamine-hydrolysing)